MDTNKSKRSHDFCMSEMDLGEGNSSAQASASCPANIYPTDYVLETDNADELNEPTFSSPPKLAFRRPGDARAFPRSRSGDRLPLVVELDTANDFDVNTEETDSITNTHSVEDGGNNLGNYTASMDTRYLRQCPQKERDYKPIESGDNTTITNSASSINNTNRIPIDSDSTLSHCQPSEEDRLTEYHCHVPKPQKDKKARNQLIAVTILCALFMTAEVLGGIISNSLALVSDATHMASDCSSFLISLFALWFAHKPATQRFTFGFHRAEVLGALISVMIIWITTGILVYLAVHRVLNNEYEINADEMLITAGLGVAFNLTMGVVLQGGFGLCKCRIHGSVLGHSHSHSNNHTKEDYDHDHSRNSRVSSNINVRAAFIHIVGDTIQSVGVLIAAYIIKYKPEYKIADPICTFLFSIVVLFTTVIILRDIFTILMEGSPKNVKYPEIQKTLQQIPGVLLAHSVQIMVLSVGKNTVSAHLAIDRSANWNSTLQTATKILREKYHVIHSTIQVEPYQEDIMSSCDQCLGPKCNGAYLRDSSCIS